MQVLDAEIAIRSALVPQVVYDEPLSSEWIFLQKLAHQCQSGALVCAWIGQARRGPRPRPRRWRRSRMPLGSL